MSSITGLTFTLFLFKFTDGLGDGMDVDQIISGELMVELACYQEPTFELDEAFTQKDQVTATFKTLY